MRQKAPTRLIALAVIGLFLSACASHNPPAVTAAGTDDDDAYCRANNVQPGSPEYTACRKDRDVQRNAAQAKADRRQRDLGEYMLNHPDHP
jgi:hypothetical protein